MRPEYASLAATGLWLVVVPQGGRVIGFDELFHGVRLNWNMLVGLSVAVTSTGNAAPPLSTCTRVTLLAL